MEQSDTDSKGNQAPQETLSVESLPAVSAPEASSLSKSSTLEPSILSSDAISVANSGDDKVSSVLVQSSAGILRDTASVSKPSFDQSSSCPAAGDLPLVGNSDPSLQFDTSAVEPKSTLSFCASQSTKSALSSGESGLDPVKCSPEFVVPDGDGSQPPFFETSDLAPSKHEQDVESGDKMETEPSACVSTKLSEEDDPMEVVEPPSNGQILSQQEEQIIAGSLPSGTQSTLPEISAGKNDLPEKTEKRATEDTAFTEKPVKRSRKNDFMSTAPNTVEAVIGSTAEIVIVLAGMAQMRAGRAFTDFEKELAATACQNIAALVSKVAPNALVSKEALESMFYDLDHKRMAQTKRDDQARAKAFAEAEALAKAEAIAKLRAEESLRAAADAEERNQAALKAAAVVVTSPTKDVQSVDAFPPPATPPGLSTQALPPSVEPPSSSPPVAPPSTQVAAQASDVSQSDTISEKSVLENSPSQQLSKTLLGKPPKVRNRMKKDFAAPSLISSDYLEYIQSQVPELQKAQVTHKQLCLAVQQFIQEQMPHAPQTLQALQPNYINTPIPCQLCKLVAKDTATVVVCDSCDKLFHVKCLQPNNHIKGVLKGDWNCPECLSGGRAYREKYGLYRRGSVNGVKLWAPHDESEDNDEVIINGSSSPLLEAGASSSGKQNGLSSSLKMQGKLTVEVETGGHTMKDDRSVGNYGGSPQLIVHLVNEPSPRTIEPVRNSSSSIGGLDNMSGSLASGSQLKLTSRPGPADNKPMLEDSEEAGVSRQKSKEKNGDADEKVGQILSTQGGSSEQGSGDISTSLAGKQVEIPILMEWVGESTRTTEGKTYYKSCRVGGLTYHLSDCALFRPETPDVPPYIARLQVLWEDLSTSHKWVRVSWCYYPTDIPLAMGRPGRAEPDEVYESNHCDNNLVGSIQGPCFVLPPKKYRMELERRKELQKRGGSRDAHPPVFLSRWLYDAPKGIFKPVTE
ncbi:hypothetical protein AXG93_862s1000 [Marchantia polymorpha subsp. ruderalis]|uniref:PHD-type domain-containing protein n=1 Tax=Marchantia polymorpha subsp. ruderalis TaxID=1480154 RepID=A0A176WIS4_MARPO|nr:hypothetical protein AXG93_862s1000 [Marchantia polymorpha subsp. ruderalis]